MKQEEDKFTGLPENAFRELKPGEVYNPLMGPSKNYPEVNIWSVAWGIAMAILFSAAAAYLGLKVGQVFEAAIPIAIIAVGVSGAAKRKNALGENVIIQSIGACSGVIVAGAIFTLPALYILQAKYPEMTVTFMQVFISSLLGGVLGILFLIPFRKYFVSDMHGKYPFPEATATTQVLISGEKGGSQAKPLLMAGMIGGLYDFIVATFGWWNENFTTRVCSAGEMLAEKAKLVFKVNTGAAVLGLGYIVGLKYASIICAGSLAVWWIIIPGMSAIWGDSVLNAWNPEITSTVGMMSPEEIFKYYAKSIGIGGIAMAGVIGIIRSWSIIKSAVGLAAKEMGGKGNVEKSIIRTQRDLSMKIIAIGSIITLILIVLFFYLDVMQGNLLHTLVAIVLVAGISFLFTTVAANAIAIVGTNPVSGMTLMTLILASVVMVAVGLKGHFGLVFAVGREEEALVFAHAAGKHHTADRGLDGQSGVAGPVRQGDGRVGRVQRAQLLHRKGGGAGKHLIELSADERHLPAPAVGFQRFGAKLRGAVRAAALSGKGIAHAHHRAQKDAYAQHHTHEPEQKTLHDTLLLCSKKGAPAQPFADCRCARRFTVRVFYSAASSAGAASSAAASGSTVAASSSPNSRRSYSSSSFSRRCR